MQKRELAMIVCLMVITGCNDNREKRDLLSANHSTLAKIPDSVLISPIYPDTVYFTVDAKISNKTEVTGSTRDFHNSSSSIHEIYFQRFAEKRGSFRVIHAVGSSIESILENGKEKNNFRQFNDTIKFDELGFFAGEPGDPVDLIPLYPGHYVKKGEYWTPKAPVKIAMGSGIANYKFVIDSLYRDNEGSLLALMNVEVNADLTPSPAFATGRVTVSGGGQITWDCTINQRRETNLEATYFAKGNQVEVKQLIKVNDQLKVYPGRKYF